MNTNLAYLLEIALCLITLAAISIALTKRPLRKTMRMLATVCPIIYGGIWFLLTNEISGLCAMLMGFVALILVFLHPSQHNEAQES